MHGEVLLTLLDFDIRRNVIGGRCDEFSRVRRVLMQARRDLRSLAD